MLWMTDLNHGASEMGAVVGGPNPSRNSILMMGVGRCWWLVSLAYQVMRWLG